ncbi:MAG: Rieske (2Fe-2S) protein [Planctomycetes bacterium]|nr:Rieske (2Fe-2S) protein [Planctomycetota bacterium]
MTWQDVGSVDDQQPGTARRVDVSGTAVALLRTEAGWTALVDHCPHAGAPLSEGVLRDGFIVCAWHGWKFDVATGACPLFKNAPSARPVEVRVEAGRVLVGTACRAD